MILAAPSAAQGTFVNWESPHVHPLELTPDGTRLLAINTPDARLEVFDTTGPRLVKLHDVPVGLDPVSVRARTNDEVWVVNHVSDSVSVISLSTANVIATFKTDDEPADVVFAGSPQRAFVSCSQSNTVQVFDPANWGASPITVPITGEEPRAMAVSADGTKVYVAVFESGNSTTILGGGVISNTFFPRNVVSDFNGPYLGQNPPPNSGTVFDPPINPALPTPPKVGLIVRKNAANQWLDDNGRNWTNKVSGSDAGSSNRPIGWDLADNDVAILDAANPTSVVYARRLMNLCMSLTVRPTTGEITVVGTEATNEVRFEPKVRGTFLRVLMARVAPVGPSTSGVFDLNPHLNYATSTVPQSERDKSVGDPRAVAWNAAGTRLWIAGMGSNNVIVADENGARVGIAPTIDVAEGPTGIVLDEPRDRAYVLSKFASKLTTISIAGETVVDTLSMHDSSPAAIKSGRKPMYDTHATSGLGQISCASCHVDTRMDGLAWDLGDPSGSIRPFGANNMAAGLPGLSTLVENYHPMKGPMTTQTLQDIIGLEPLHWRGDRTGLEEFNPAYQNLQGDDAQISALEMQQFEDFLATVAYPPNPFRNFDNSLPTSLPLPGHYTTGRFAPAGQPLPNGNAQTGLSNHRTLLLDSGSNSCVKCHTLPTGAGTDHRVVSGVLTPIAPGPNGEHHLMLVSQDFTTMVSTKVPQLRNQYEKTGFSLTQLVSTRGFGYLHDGAIDSIERFVSEPTFHVTSDQMVANLTAFLLAFSGSELPAGSTNPAANEPPGPPSKDSHAAVGRQLTLRAAPTASESNLLTSMTTLANANKVGLIVKGVVGGLPRGGTYTGSTWQSDRANETWTTGFLTASASTGAEITFTVVPTGTKTRLGIDRDNDSWFDRDELDVGSDPADELDFPGLAGRAYCFGDGSGTACPCGNASAIGDASGCLHSSGAGGKLVGVGGASVALDTLVLTGTQMPDGPALYFQGSSPVASGAGLVFGDGLRCAGGTVIRLRVRTNVAGASQYPGVGDPSVSTAGLVSAPGVFDYQVWYRDSAAFCSPSTFNLTNGWRVVWAP